MSDHDLAPVIDDDVFRAVQPSAAPVNVPLVLVRHVAEPPRSRGVTVELAARLKRRVAELRDRREAALSWTPGEGWRGPAPGAVEYFFEEGSIQVYAKGSPEARAATTRTVLLDANGALLLQGTLNGFLHYLNPLAAERVEQAPYLDEEVLRPEMINQYLIQLVQWARGRLEDGASSVRLFAAPTRDLFGERGVLRATWVVDPPHISWGWSSEDRSVSLYLDVRQAAWVSGFITLLRMALPDEWRWTPSDSESGGSDA